MNAWNETARGLIGREARAPSSHNTQPWRFRVRESAIELYADRKRALPANDPKDRELVISCGCALLNLRLAAAEAGLAASPRLLPEADAPDLLARVTFVTQAQSDEASLAQWIDKRSTCRNHFASGEIRASIVKELARAAEMEGAQFEPILSEEARKAAAGLVAEGDAAQWKDPNWRRELAEWMRPGGRGDGLTVNAWAAPVARALIRAFDMGEKIGAKDRELAESAPLLAVLSTKSDAPADWIRAGQALQRTLLTGCRHGLQAGYLNQPIQVSLLRPRLQSPVSAGFPQIILRMGRRLEAPRTAPRRAPEEVIEPYTP